MNWLNKLVNRHINQDDTLLDLGCGIMQGTDELKAKCILGVDIWDKYLNHIKDRFLTCRINMEETDRFMDKSYDIVICLDVVEHLDRQLALKIIDECKRIARKKAIIYTPSEFKDNMEAVKDAWGLGECQYQEHKCVLSIDDFNSRGYTTSIVTDKGIFATWESH